MSKLVGLAWLPRRSYAAIRSTMDDAVFFPPTYDEWLPRAERVKEAVCATGATVLQVGLDTPEFFSFCRERGLRFDAVGRGRYAHFVAERRSREIAAACDKSRRDIPPDGH